MCKSKIRYGGLNMVLYEWCLGVWPPGFNMSDPKFQFKNGVVYSIIVYHRWLWTKQTITYITLLLIQSHLLRWFTEYYYIHNLLKIIYDNLGQLNFRVTLLLRLPLEDTLMLRISRWFQGLGDARYTQIHWLSTLRGGLLQTVCTQTIQDIGWLCTNQDHVYSHV